MTINASKCHSFGIYKKGTTSRQYKLKFYLDNGLIWKMVNTWPKKFLCYPLSKIGVFDLYPEFVEKNKEKKVAFSSILALFVMPSMLI